MNTNIGSDTNIGSHTDYVARDKYGMYSTDNNQGPGPALMGADTLLGNSVYNADEEDLGTIKEFMIEMASGKIAYAVLSYGGFLGMGDKLFAVPWDALELDTVNHRFVLDIDKETLKNAPGFDKDHWPSMADRTWATQVHQFYGTTYRPSDETGYGRESGTSGTYGASDRDDLRQ
jgi:sporulation protein YlmC with PRC-barrel domain